MKIKGKMEFEFDTEFINDSESTEETVLMLMEEDLCHAQDSGKICGYVEGSLKLVKPPTFKECDKVSEILTKFFKEASTLEKVKLYNYMFISIYSVVTDDLPIEDLENNKELIKDWLINGLGYYDDINNLFNFVDGRETLEKLNEIYQEASNEE